MQKLLKKYKKILKKIRKKQIYEKIHNKSGSRARLHQSHLSPGNIKQKNIKKDKKNAKFIKNIKKDKKNTKI